MSSNINADSVQRLKTNILGTVCAKDTDGYCFENTSERYDNMQ